MWRTQLSVGRFLPRMVNTNRSYQTSTELNLTWLYFITRNTFCGTWYLPHSHVHNERTVPIMMAGCMAHARNGYIFTSGLKSDVTIVFLVPDFLMWMKSMRQDTRECSTLQNWPASMLTTCCYEWLMHINETTKPAHCGQRPNLFHAELTWCHRTPDPLLDIDRLLLASETRKHDKTSTSVEDSIMSDMQTRVHVAWLS